jgi:heme-degrading monooxygenase HmoA
MIVVLFRSRLTPQAGEDYAAMDAEMSARIQENPGFVAVKSYRSEDGERLTVVWFRDEETLAQWRNLERHREAQNTGRAQWYEYYDMEVATVTRESHFRKKPAPAGETVSAD